MQAKRRQAMSQVDAATNGRTFRTFLLMQQLEAKEIGARITRARNELGITQEALAEMASFSKRSLQDYETGYTIPWKHFRELSRLLNKPPEWFLYGEPRAGTGDQLAEIIERLDRIEKRLP